VITECKSGAIPFRVSCTDPTLTVVQILEGYGRRWAIEVCFRELKQLLGFADSSALFVFDAGSARRWRRSWRVIPTWGTASSPGTASLPWNVVVGG
jgi:hypothetical protein